MSREEIAVRRSEILGEFFILSRGLLSKPCVRSKALGVVVVGHEHFSLRNMFEATLACRATVKMRL